MKKKEGQLQEIDVTYDMVIWNNAGSRLPELYYKPGRFKLGGWLLCLRGEMDIEINQVCYHVGAGNLVSLVPGALAHFCAVSDDLRIYILVFSSSFLTKACLIRSNMNFSYFMLESPILALTSGQARLFRDYFDLLCRSYPPGAYVEDEVPYCVLAAMFARMNTFYKVQKTDNHTLDAGEKLYRHFLSLLREHYMAHRDVAFYAAELKVTRQHLNKVVRRLAGISTFDAIARMVICDAEGSLRYTSLTERQIAESLGFPDVSTFGKYFKRYQGVAPSEYRKG